MVPEPRARSLSASMPSSSAGPSKLAAQEHHGVFGVRLGAALIAELSDSADNGVRDTK